MQSRPFSENEAKSKTFSAVEMQFEYMKRLWLRVELSVINFIFVFLSSCEKVS